MKQKTKDLLITIGVIITLLYLGTFLLIDSFSGDKNVNITFNVTGITNATNSSLVSLQLECIKFCGKELRNMGRAEMYECWNKCERLGK